MPMIVVAVKHMAGLKYQVVLEGDAPPHEYGKDPRSRADEKGVKVKIPSTAVEDAWPIGAAVAAPVADKGKSKSKNHGDD